MLAFGLLLDCSLGCSESASKSASSVVAATGRTQCLRHAGVPLAPKDLRASFITFLRSSDHNDATLRAAAYAMRHSSRTQESVAYDKGQGDRLVEAAVRAAESYAVSFG